MTKNLLILLIPVIIGLFFYEKHQYNDTFLEDTTLHVDSLLTKANAYRRVDVDSMVLLSIEATEYSTHNNYEYGYLQGLLQQGIAYFQKGNDSITLSIIREIETHESKKSKEIEFIIARKNSLRGNIYHQQNQYDSSAIYMFKALETFENQDNQLQVAITSSNISANYLALNHYDRALKFIQKSEFGFQQENYEEGLIVVYERIGTIYTHEEQYDSALFYFQKSLELSQKINHVYFMANGYHNIGLLHIKRKQFELGENYLQKAITLYQEQENLLGYVTTINSLAKIDLERKQYQTALSKYQNINKIASENNFLPLQEKSHEEISKIYKEQGNFELALKHYQTAQTIHDSLNNKDRLKTINTLENQYQNARKDKVILGQEVAIQISHNRGLFLLLILMVIIAISFFLIYKRRIENQLLAEKNNLIKHQQAELKHRMTNQLEQLSDLFTIYGFMNNEDSEILKEAQCRIEAINLVYRYLENSKEDSIYIQPFIEKLVENILVIYGIEKGQIEVDMNVVDIKMDANQTQIIGQIVNEILNNTLKHAFDVEMNQRKISVKLLKELSNFKLIIGDNGQGFDPKKQKTDRMGLSLIAAFVKSIRGEMTTETGNNGTTYYIDFS